MSDLTHNWRVALNRFYEDSDYMLNSDKRRPGYEAIDVFGEIERLPRLFKAEREGTLPKLHQQCSMSEPVELPENSLGCCLGFRCSECLILAPLDSIDGATSDEIDKAKAITCITHVLMSGGDPAKEGYVLTDDDVLFWRNTYASMAGCDPDCCPSCGHPDPHDAHENAVNSPAVICLDEMCGCESGWMPLPKPPEQEEPDFIHQHEARVASEPCDCGITGCVGDPVEECDCGGDCNEVGHRAMTEAK